MVRNLVRGELHYQKNWKTERPGVGNSPSTTIRSTFAREDAIYVTDEAQSEWNEVSNAHIL